MTLSPAEIGLTAAVVLLLFALAAVLLLKTRNGSANEAVLRAQSELSGRLAQFSEHYALEQDKLARLLAEQKLSVLQMIDEKLLLITRKVGEGLQMSAGKTDETLGALRERLAKIDAAQEKISSLSEQVVSLQEILANKQARGAFGEIQLNDLVSSILPPSAYSFQTVLGNQKRADCLLRLPNPPGAIVVDSKFPLESYQALRQAKSEREKLEAERFFKASVVKHIRSRLRRAARQFCRRGGLFLPRQGLDRVADHPDGHLKHRARGVKRRPHARRGRRHPAGGRTPDRRRLPSERTRGQSVPAF